MNHSGFKVSIAGMIVAAFAAILLSTAYPGSAEFDNAPMWLLWTFGTLLALTGLTLCLAQPNTSSLDRTTS